jgi:hypothetical protein
MSLVLSVRKAEMGANTVKTRHYKIKCTNDGKFRLSKNRLFADMTDLIKFCQSKVFAFVVTLNNGDHMV